jgi:hypothetical protein
VVDTNHDGVIEFHEFLAAMAEWMQEDLSKSGSQKKRGRQDEVRPGSFCVLALNGIGAHRHTQED